jgi:RNA polymerase sigma-70 factor (ECF subfamily)
MRVVREPEAALDVAQTALLQMVEALPRYESRGRFSAWLFTIVQNACRRTFRRTSLVRDPGIDPDELFAAGPSVEEGYFSREDERRVLDAMQRALEPQERAALWLRAQEGMSVDEITDLLRLDGASGARALLQTARRKLRAALAAGESRGERP